MPHDIEPFARLRGFTAEELTRYEVWAKDEHHIIFPILGRNGAWYERQRCSGGCHPKYMGPKGEPSHLYNPLGLGPHSPEVWIAEGELDTLSLITVGAPALGVLGASNFTKEWWHLFFAAEIVMALDPDDAGKKAMEQWAVYFQVAGTNWRIFDPSPYEDINDFFVQDSEGLEAKVKGWSE